MWNFHDFSITQIFHEINLRILGVQNQPFYTFRGSELWLFVNFCIFWRLKCSKMIIIRTPKVTKMSDLQLLGRGPSKLVSRKIWMTEKSWNFHTVICTFLWQNKPHKKRKLSKDNLASRVSLKLMNSYKSSHMFSSTICWRNYNYEN